MLRQDQKSVRSWWRNSAPNHKILNRKDLTLLYNVLLNRDPDPGGIKTYMQHIEENNIIKLNAIAAMIIDSHEFRSIHGLEKKGTFSEYHRLAWTNYRDLSYEGVRSKLPASDFTAGDLSSTGVYEPYVSDHMFKNLAKVSCFVDIGANLGLFALPIAVKLGPQGHVYAFEASQRNSNLLQQNIWLNNIENITVYPVGVGDTNGAVFSDADLTTSNVTLFDAPIKSSHVDVVPIVTLDSFWDPQKKIDMIKIDIEGFEYKFFLGAKECIKKWHPSIYMEYSDVFQQRGSGVNGKLLLSMLLDLDYRSTILHRTKEAEIVSTDSSLAISRIHDVLEYHIEHDRGTHLDLYFEQKVPQ